MPQTYVKCILWQKDMDSGLTFWTDSALQHILYTHSHEAVIHLLEYVCHLDASVHCWLLQRVHHLTRSCLQTGWREQAEGLSVQPTQVCPPAETGLQLDSAGHLHGYYRWNAVNTKHDITCWNNFMANKMRKILQWGHFNLNHNCHCLHRLQTHPNTFYPAGIGQYVHTEKEYVNISAWYEKSNMIYWQAVIKITSQIWNTVLNSQKHVSQKSHSTVSKSL